MAETKILEEYVLNYEQWRGFIKNVEKVLDGTIKGEVTIAKLDELVGILFPDVPPRDYQQVLGQAYPKMLEAFAREVPNQTEKVNQLLEQIKNKDIAKDTDGSREKIKFELGRLAKGAEVIQRKINANEAANLPVAEIKSTGRIIPEIPKTEEKPVQETELHYKEGEVVGLQPRSQQKQHEMEATERNKQRQDEKRARYAGESLPAWRDPAGFAGRVFGGFAQQVLRREQSEKIQQEAPQPKTFLGKISASVRNIGVKPSEEKTAQSASVERVARERKSAASIDRLQRAAAVSGTVGGVFGVWNSLKNTVREGIIGIKQESSKEIPQQRPVSTVEKSINTARFEKKPSKDGETQRASRIYDPRGAGVVKNTVSPGSNLGMMARASGAASRAVSFDSFMNIFDVLSRGGVGITRFFQGAFASGNKIFLIIFLVVIFVPMGVLVFMQTMKQSAFVQFTKIGPRGDYKSAKPVAPFTLTKTANYNPQTGLITYAINGPENGQDTLKIIYKNGNLETKTGGKTFDASGLKDATVINTYTANKISATAVTVVGNGPLEAIGCPIVNIDRGVSLGSQNGKTGHCGDNYKAPEVCKGGETPWRGNEMAMDIYSAQNMVGEPVVLPAVTIDGKIEQIDWVYRGTAGDVDASQGFVQYVSKKTFLDPADNKQKYLLVELHHLDKNNINTAANVKSGTVVGTLGSFSDGSSSPHVHIQFGTGEQITGAGVVNPQGVTWVKAETFLQHCETPPV